MSSFKCNTLYPAVCLGYRISNLVVSGMLMPGSQFVYLAKIDKKS
jgi:hypothetical protein